MQKSKKELKVLTDKNRQNGIVDQKLQEENFKAQLPEEVLHLIFQALDGGIHLSSWKSECGSVRIIRIQNPYSGEYFDAEYPSLTTYDLDQFRIQIEDFISDIDYEKQRTRLKETALSKLTKEEREALDL